MTRTGEPDVAALMAQLAANAAEIAVLKAEKEALSRRVVKLDVTLPLNLRFLPLNVRQGSQGRLRLAAMDREGDHAGAIGAEAVQRAVTLRPTCSGDRLLVTVDRIGRQIENRRHASTSNTIERT